jgi:hypothetical protein
MRLAQRRVTQKRLQSGERGLVPCHMCVIWPIDHYECASAPGTSAVGVFGSPCGSRTAVTCATNIYSIRHMRLHPCPADQYEGDKTWASCDTLGWGPHACTYGPARPNRRCCYRCWIDANQGPRDVEQTFPQSLRDSLEDMFHKKYSTR